VAALYVTAVALGCRTAVSVTHCSCEAVAPLLFFNPL